MKGGRRTGGVLRSEGVGVAEPGVEGGRVEVEHDVAEARGAERVEARREGAMLVGCEPATEAPREQAREGCDTALDAPA